MNRDKATGQNITFYDEDRDIIAHARKQNSYLESNSAAVRYILREWYKSVSANAEVVVTPQASAEA